MQLRRSFLGVSILLASVIAVAQGPTATAPKIEGIPGPLAWHNQPASYQIENGALTIVSKPGQDWYVDAFDAGVIQSTPILAFDPGENFVLSAKVKVDFRSAWDAGSLMLWADDTHWAKFAFENSAAKSPATPSMVSVVTRGTSDDTGSDSIGGDTVYMQVIRRGPAFVFNFSRDGKSWQILRVFRLDAPGKVLVGFESQSPDGKGTKATFSEIRFEAKRVPNPFTGKD